MLVRIGPVKNVSSVRSRSLDGTLVAESRKRLGELPGVEVLAERGAPRPGVPLVLVSPSIRELGVMRDGGEVVYSARVEFVLYAMPGEAIAASVSGRASTVAPLREARNRRRNAALHREVLEAAVVSALRRASLAVAAAARL